MQTCVHMFTAFFLLLLGANAAKQKEAAKTNPDSVTLHFINQAGSPVEIYWVNTFDVKPGQEPDLVIQTDKPIRNGSETIINSYHRHKFRIQFVKTNPNRAYAEMYKLPKDEKATITFDGKNLTVTQATAFDELVNDFKSAMTICGKERKDGYHECLANNVFAKTQEVIEQTEQMKKYRDKMSEKLRNYTCSDPKMNTTEELSITTLNYKNKPLELFNLLDNSHAKIWYVKNFVTPEECEVLRKHGKPRLRRATVAAADGSSVVSEHRKAQQASYNLHQLNGKSDPLKYFHI